MVTNLRIDIDFCTFINNRSDSLISSPVAIRLAKIDSVPHLEYLAHLLDDAVTTQATKAPTIPMKSAATGFAQR